MELTLAADALHDLLVAPVLHLLDDVATHTDDGLALAPLDAAACTRDARRTSVFLHAVHDAIRDARARFPHETIDILYAGTGPLASLLLPLLPRFEGEPLACTMLDLHARSLDAVQTLARLLDVETAIRRYAVADASTYVHDRAPHIVITETLQRALTREPHVAIVRNLSAQLAPRGILLPECVRVELVLGDPRDCTNALPLATLIDAGRVTNDAPRLVTLPRTIEPGAFPLYRTTIRVYGEHVLDAHESGLTQPEIVRELLPLVPGSTWEFRYRMGREPGLAARRVS